MVRRQHPETGLVFHRNWLGGDVMKPLSKTWPADVIVLETYGRHSIDGCTMRSDAEPPVRVSLANTWLSVLTGVTEI